MAMELGRRILFVFYILTTIFDCLTDAQPAPDEFEAYYCNYKYTSNYTSNSVFRTHLDTIPSILSSSNSRYYYFSIGQDPDRVEVIALCRRDVAIDICKSCLRDANTKLRELCPNQKQSIGLYDRCMLRYSDRGIHKTWQALPNAYRYNPTTVSTGITYQFNQAVSTLLSDQLVDRASRGTSAQKFATGTTTTGLHSNITIYALAECTPDLSREDCRDCLNRTGEVLQKCCNGRIGGIVLYPSCNFRYEIRPFYSEITNDEPKPQQQPQPQPTDTGKDDKKTRTVIIILIPSIIFVISVIACICIFMRKQRKQKPLDKSEPVNQFSTVQSLQYDFDIIRAATNEFSDTNKLGQGGFGVVYKGRLLDGRDIAVKQLSKSSDQGELQFKNEIMLLANLQHRNLVTLLGFCLKGTERLLIYEFIPNASLDRFIFDPEKHGHLDGYMRYKIIRGIARGLCIFTKILDYGLSIVISKLATFC